MDTASKIGIGLVGGVGMGAAVMYLLEPGRRQRPRGGPDGDASSGAVDGSVAQVLADLRTGLSDDIPPEALVGRVRAVLERIVSQPSAIAVRIEDRHIRLSGPASAREAHDAVRHVRRVAGSRSVEDALDRREPPARMSRASAR